MVKSVELVFKKYKKKIAELKSTLKRRNKLVELLWNAHVFKNQEVYTMVQGHVQEDPSLVRWFNKKIGESSEPESEEEEEDLSPEGDPALLEVPPEDGATQGRPSDHNLIGESAAARDDKSSA